MNTLSDISKDPNRNITWEGEPPPTQCEHRYEVIALDEGGVIKRCFKCGSLEAP